MMVLNNLRKLLAQKGFREFTRPYELNILGVRSRNRTPDTFDDEFYVFWVDKAGKWQIRVYKGTTDPGTYLLRNPLHARGTAIVKEGQYYNCWKIGLHKGQYEALVQAGTIRVLIDNNRDAILDLNQATEVNGEGINLHRARLGGKTIDVGRWSAGCQVLANDTDFNELLTLAKRHSGLYGNHFSYSLIDLRDYQSWQFNQVALSSLMIGGLVLLSDKNKLADRVWANVKKWLSDD